LKAIADTSSLIHPAKVRRFWRLMRNTFEEILVPNAVYQEILKGKEIGSPDVPVIEEAVREGWIRVMPGPP
jgi:predicted nucleic acid-binding protein